MNSIFASRRHEGFRAPSLNELYRPFRVGQITTLANAALTPEELYGTEVGVGGVFHGVTWQTTVFWNQLHDAIANVTVGTNLQERENAGDINAYGMEFDAAYPVTDWAALTASFDDVNASLNGNQPQQAPRWTVNAGCRVSSRCRRLTVDAFLRFHRGQALLRRRQHAVARARRDDDVRRADLLSADGSAVGLHLRRQPVRTPASARPPR